MTDPRFPSASSSGWSLVNAIKQSRPVDLTKPYDPSSLRNKTIIITGGSSGFGAAFSREWASHGAQIIIGDLDDTAGTQLISELNTSYSLDNDTIHHFQHCDVTNWQDQVSLFQLARRVSPTGCINGVVAGAGIVETGNLVEGPTFEIPHPSSSSSSSSSDCPPEPRLKVLAVNITGVMYTVHLALFHLERNPLPTPQADRHILLISSVAGLIPLPGQVEYTVSKHGVMGLFRSLRSTSYTRQGVRVNVINPYFVETPLINDRGVGLLAGGAMAQLEDVLDAATRLMADERIIGRGLAIGPKVKVLEDPETGDFTLDTTTTSTAEGKGKEGKEGKAVWEIYGHDYDQVEVFMWRFVRLLNLVTAVRGWMGILADLFRLRRRNVKEPRRTVGNGGGCGGGSGVRSGRVEKKKTR